MRNVGYYDMAAGTVGKGTDVYGVPGLHSGSVIYFYRKDLFEEAGPSSRPRPGTSSWRPP